MGQTPTKTEVRERLIPTRPKKATRCYSLEHRGNPGKVERVARVLGLYRETMRHIQASQWRAWTEEGQPFWNRRSVTDIPCALIARYKNSAQDQVVAGLNSWLGLAQRAISEARRPLRAVRGGQGHPVVAERLRHSPGSHGQCSRVDQGRWGVAGQVCEQACSNRRRTATLLSTATQKSTDGHETEYRKFVPSILRNVDGNKWM